MRVWHTAQKIQMFGLIVRRHRFLCPFPHSFSISSISVHFLILSPFPHSLSISSFSFHFLILFPFPHSLSISSFSVHFLILSPFPHSLSISSFSLHFLILCPFPHSLSISSFSFTGKQTIKLLKECFQQIPLIASLIIPQHSLCKNPPIIGTN